MSRIPRVVALGLILCACTDDSITNTRKSPPPPPPDVIALYEGTWSLEASEVVAGVSRLCNGNPEIRISGWTSECPSAVTFSSQAGASLEGDLLIRVSPNGINPLDDVWGTLTGAVDTTGSVTATVSVHGGDGKPFEALTGCTGLVGDSALSGNVANGTLDLGATFTGICINGIDSSQVTTQWTLEFTGVASPLDLASANVTVSPSAFTLQSGTSAQLEITVQDGTGFALAQPLAAWSSADTSIARVTPDGVVSVVEVGATTVTARAAGQSGVSTITVSGFDFAGVSAGLFFSCGVSADEAACWGNGRQGQLGNGTREEFRLSPVAVEGEIPFASVSAGSRHACGLTAGGEAHCWGDGQSGQLGDGSTGGSTFHTTPGPVSGGLEFVAIHAGGAHTCALAKGGLLYCWGNNEFGQLGVGTETSHPTPTVVGGGFQFASVTTGDAHSCGLTPGGLAYCWGENSYGQVGDGSTIQRNAPTLVGGGLEFTTLTAGGTHTCGLSRDGIVYCWGDNDYGQLGDGTSAGRSTPTPVSGGLPLVSLSAGSFHTCGLTADGLAYCWGANNLSSQHGGQLGDGTLTNRLVPVQVHGGIAFEHVSAGYAHTCGLSTDSVAFCWGSGRATGDGTGTRSAVPVRVAGQP